MRKILLAMLLISPCTYALTQDEGQIAKITADSVEINNKTGVAKYIGHVQAIQGTTKIAAETVTVFRDDNQNVEKIVAVGSPAQYSTILDNTNRPFDSSAHRIVYLPQAGKIFLDQNAQLKLADNSFSGEKINYDKDTQKLVSAPSKHGQTRIVLAPEKPATKTATHFKKQAKSIAKNNTPKHLAKSEGYLAITK